jgi:palmitoyl transferase
MAQQFQYRAKTLERPQRTPVSRFKRKTSNTRNNTQSFYFYTMSLFNFKKFATTLLLTAMLASTAQTSFAQQQQTTAETPVVAETKEPGWWDQSKSKTLNIVDNGSLAMILSGYARHGRDTYTPERIAELNENAWGLGFSKSIRTPKDNEESLYALAISDSHFQPQFMAGYLHQWMRPLGSKYEAGVGVTALLISRTDYFSGVPFPGILPVASIGTRKSKLMAAYIPRISQNKGNGDVLLVFVRFDLN